MRRRICLAVGLVALSVPASSGAQSSSQAQYQGVAPETQLPVTGTGGGPSGGLATVTGSGSTQGNGASSATGGGRPVSGGNGAGGGSAANGGGGTTASQPKIALPDASSSTSPFSGGDIALIVIAIAGLTGLGLLLRRTTRRSPAV